MTDDDEAVDPDILIRFEKWLETSELHREAARLAAGALASVAAERERRPAALPFLRLCKAAARTPPYSTRRHRSFLATAYGIVQMLSPPLRTLNLAGTE